MLPLVIDGRVKGVLSLVSLRADRYTASESVVVEDVARRIGLAMNYCVGWMRQQENQQLGIPREIAKAFSPRLRKLGGYGLYRRLLGHIDKCSPVDLLDETGPRRIVGEI